MAKFNKDQLLNHLYYKRLPQVYREADIDTELSLKRFLQAMIEGGFATALTSTEKLTDLTDPLKCPAEIFPMLFESFGYKYSYDIDISYQRKILQNHGILFQKRGTRDYIKILIKILLNYDSDISIQRVDGVRVLTVTLYADSAVSEETDKYITLVEKFIKEGFIPFYLDTNTQIIITTIDVKMNNNYTATQIGVSAKFDLSPVEDVSKEGLAYYFENTFRDEPFSEFEIYGYSKIVPKYLNPNLLNPLTVITENAQVLESGSNTFKSFDLVTPYLYVPYGNKIFIKTKYAGNSPYLKVYVYPRKYDNYSTLPIGSVEVLSSSFSNVNGIVQSAVADLTPILMSSLIEGDYYIRLGITDSRVAGQTVSLADYVCAWVEDKNYAVYSATTRLRFDDEYDKDSTVIPTYMVDVFDSNGPMTAPYCAYAVSTEFSNSGEIIFKVPSTNIVFCTDGITAMSDRKAEETTHFWFTLALQSTDFNFLSVKQEVSTPIVNVLCTNNKGVLKTVRAVCEVDEFDNETMFRGLAYSVAIPKDCVVVRTEFSASYPEPNTYGACFVVKNFACYECSSEGTPYIDSPPQPYSLANNGLSTYTNNLTVGIDGIALLSYNDTDGRALVRDSYNVLTGEITRRVTAVNDSNGNPVSVQVLANPVVEKITEDLNGEVKPIALKSFTGKTYVSMCQSIPLARYEITGGKDYHSYVSATTKEIR